MRATLNRRFFLETGVDSGALTLLGSVVHRFAEGRYAGTVWKGERAVGQFDLDVTDDVDVMQTDIDLALLAGPQATYAEGCVPETGRSFCLNPRGYALFFVSQGAGGYHVTVHDADKREPVFDSRTLTAGDLFAVTLLMPGAYAMQDVLTGAHAEIDVAYPSREKLGRGPLPPVTVRVTEKGFDPAAIRIMSSQGQVFHIQARSRVKIALEKAHDAPETPGKPPRREREARRETATRPRTYAWRGPKPGKESGS